ncbi:MAG: cytochrome P450 [Anaerolineales bacterium]|jgi:cytochrome P450|nr:cytochrome P450 [Anaerolineales bacterium]
MKSPGSDPETGLAVLKAFIAEKSPLGPLRVMAEQVGRFFQVPLPFFNPYIVHGPAAVRKVLVTERDKFLWRNQDPVTDLLDRGVLVTDGQEHDHYRKLMEPSLHPGRLPGYAEMMRQQTERVSAAWQDGQTVDLLVEGRKIALLIILQALFSRDAWDDLPRIWMPILKAINFISPGAWILWRRIPRPGYKKHLKTLDVYLYEIIAGRRKALSDIRYSNTRGLNIEAPKNDLLQHLLDAGLPDERIRDQMLTMLIAGHDTSTALLAWIFTLLGQNPQVCASLVRALDESEPGQTPPLLDQVIKETLRLYPPIHIGNRIAAQDVTFGEGETIPAGARMFYSIYLTQRDPAIWENPDQFQPERFARGRTPLGSTGQATPPMSFIPFGGGPRACIGAAFGQAEARIVVSYLLQNFDFQPINPHEIHPQMGATLEPRPGVRMKIARRQPPNQKSQT